jgi:hypothetical protein
LLALNVLLAHSRTLARTNRDRELALAITIAAVAYDEDLADSLMEMRGRLMQGWLRVDPVDVRTKGQLAKWVELGTTYARSLPAKR